MPRSDAWHRLAMAGIALTPSSMAVNRSSSMALASAADRWYAKSVSKTISADGMVLDVGMREILSESVDASRVDDGKAFVVNRRTETSHVVLFDRF